MKPKKTIFIRVKKVFLADKEFATNTYWVQVYLYLEGALAVTLVFTFKYLHITCNISININFGIYHNRMLLYFTISLPIP